MPDATQLDAIARACRVQIIRMLTHAGSGHPGGSLSVIDLLVTIAFGRLRHDPRRPDWPDRDRIVLSKGHAVPALYTVMARAGYFPEIAAHRCASSAARCRAIPIAWRCPASRRPPARWARACRWPAAWRSGSSSRPRPPASTASSATARSRRARCGRRPWPRPSSASPTTRSTTSRAIVDYNRIQLDDFVAKILDLEPLLAKWQSFDWPVLEIDGHDVAQIGKALDQAEATRGAPTLIVAHTDQGQGRVLHGEQPRVARQGAEARGGGAPPFARSSA